MEDSYWTQAQLQGETNTPTPEISGPESVDRCPVATHTVEDCTDCGSVRCAAARHTVENCTDCGPVRCEDVGTQGHRVEDCQNCRDRRCDLHEPDHLVEDCDECGTVRCDRHTADHDVSLCWHCHVLQKPAAAPIAGVDLGAWDIPGFGEAASGCGIYYPSGVCSSCGLVHFSTHQCGRRTCTNCWSQWAREAAVRQALRISAYRETQPANIQRRTVHAVVSPPQGKVNDLDDVRWARRVAADLAEQQGIRGGAVIFHPFRPNDSMKREWERVKDIVDCGMWVYIRRQSDSMDDLLDRVDWSPHFHVVGPAVDVKEGDSEADGGWVFQNVRSLKPYDGPEDTEALADTYGLFRYLASHVGFSADESMHAVTWYGDLSYNVFGEREMPPTSVVSRIERRLLEMAGEFRETREDGEGGDTDDTRRCVADDCAGEVVQMFEVDELLERVEFPERVRDRIDVAVAWWMGDAIPPPGLKRPRSEEEAREALAALL